MIGYESSPHDEMAPSLTHKGRFPYTIIHLKQVLSSHLTITSPRWATRLSFHSRHVGLMSALVIFFVISKTYCLALGAEIQQVKSWTYEPQNAVPAGLANSCYDLVVVGHSRDGTDSEAYASAEIKTIRDAGKISDSDET
jgi:hypothetical protein